MYLNNRFKCIQAEWPASMLTSPIDQKCGLWVLTWNFQSDKIKEIISIWKSDADQDLPCNQKALTWIAASSPLNLGSERGMGPIPDSSYSPLSFKVCFKAPDCFGGSISHKKGLLDHCPYRLQPHTESSKGPANPPTTVQM